MSTQRLNKDWAIITAAALFTLAVVRVPVPDGQSRDLMRLVAEMAILFVFSVFVYRRVNEWVGMFMVLALVSSVYPAFGRISYLARDAIMFGCAWYAFVALAVKGNRVGILLDAMCLIALANTVFLALQVFGVDPYKIFSFGLMKTRGTPEIIGLMANRNEAGALIAMCVPAFFRKSRWQALPVIFFGLVMAKSTGPIVALVFGLAFAAWRMKRSLDRRIFVIICAVVVCGSYLTTVYVLYYDTNLVESATRRLEILQLGVPFFVQTPLMGAGLGHWAVLTNQLHAHSDIWQAVFEMGLLAGVLIAGYLFSQRFIVDLMKLTALGTIVFLSSMSFIWHVATTAIVAVTWLAILEITLNGEVEGNLTSISYTASARHNA